MNNVFVYLEIEGTSIADVSLELLTKGRKLANQLGWKQLLPETNWLALRSRCCRMAWTNCMYLMLRGCSLILRFLILPF